MDRMPFPSNDKAPLAAVSLAETDDMPWQKLNPAEMMPMMFSLQFCNGSIVSFAYSDLREFRVRDSGHVILSLFGMEKYRVTIEGRNLGELAHLLGLGRIRWAAERDPRAAQQPESEASISQIAVEALTGP